PQSIIKRQQLVALHRSIHAASPFLPVVRATSPTRRKALCRMQIVCQWLKYYRKLTALRVEKSGKH
ncbi:MAG: hypothetical protein ACUVTH_01615, partial [Thermogutta sp.]